MKSPLERLEDAAAISLSITEEEIEELPPHTMEQLAAMGYLATLVGADTITIICALMQAFILGQRSAIDIPDWEN